MRTVAAAKVSRAGGGRHLPYIVRPEAVLPDRGGEARDDERQVPLIKRHGHLRGVRVKGLSGPQPEKADPREGIHEEKDNGSALNKADTIWTWNTPGYITGDSHGTQADSDKRRKAGLERGLKLAGVTSSGRPDQRSLTLEEKAENARAYFSLLSDSEKKREELTLIVLC